MQDDPIAFSDLDFKEKVIYISAIASFVLGWVLIFVGLVMPPLGQIHPTVLSGFGIALVFTSGMLGVTLYIKANNMEIMNRIADYVSKRLEEKQMEAEDNAGK